jgi:hypothetical protein
MRTASSLSRGVLARANRFLLELNEDLKPSRLRELIPAWVSRLIPGDRTSFNELDSSPRRMAIVPHPLPSWWHQYGEAYNRHLLDHPLWDSLRAPTLNRAILFSDRRYAARWKTCALNHEYFVPLGLRHQVSIMIYRHGTSLLGLAVNRSRSDFDEDDRRLLNLLGPHVTCAWRNAQQLAALQTSVDAAKGVLPDDRALISVDSGRTAARALSPSAGALLRKYFSTDSDGRDRLPDHLGRWLRDQQARRQGDAIAAPPGAPFVVRRHDGILTARIMQVRTEDTLVLLEETSAPAGPGNPGFSGLTRRESEILGWMTEGKRNTEIALILGIRAHGGKACGKPVREARRRDPRRRDAVGDGSTRETPCLTSRPATASGCTMPIPVRGRWP